MDILEFAIEREREIGQFYHRLAERMPHAGVRNVLEMLAVGEETHAHIIEQMKHQSSIINPAPPALQVPWPPV